VFHPLFSGYGRESTTSSSKIKEDLHALRHDWSKTSVSPKGKINTLLKVTGLEWAFAPVVVLETLVEDDPRGPRVLYSDRKGRILADCKASNKVLGKGLKQRFNYPWIAGKVIPAKERCNKLSNVLDVISKHGILENAIRPLSRFFTQLLKLSNRDFKGLLHSIMGCYSSKFKLGRNLERSPALYGKPTLSRGGGKSWHNGQVRMPQWHWTDQVRSASSCCKTWKTSLKPGPL
jgi:hypothetical protein